MLRPLISIILPVFNGAKFVAQSIESILKQTETNWELIIINDASTDNTLDIVQKYSQTDSRIQVFSNPKNQNLPESLNIGFSKSKGEFLTWTSDDNLYKRDALKIMLNYLQNNKNVDLVCADCEWVDENLNFIRNFSDRCSPLVLCYINNVGACFMYRRSIAEKIGKYDKNFFLVEDWDYFVRIALNGNIAYLEDNLYIYRTHSQNLSSIKKVECEKTAKKVRSRYWKELIKNYSKSHLQTAKMYNNLYKSKVLKNINLDIFCFHFLIYLTHYLCLLIPIKKLRKTIRKFLQRKLLWL